MPNLSITYNQPVPNMARQIPNWQVEIRISNLEIEVFMKNSECSKLKIASDIAPNDKLEMYWVSQVVIYSDEGIKVW